MWIFKKLAHWWRDEYGGEYVAHADFSMEPGDTFASAFAELFEGAGNPEWTQPVPEGSEVRVHVKFSFSSVVAREGGGKCSD